MNKKHIIYCVAPMLFVFVGAGIVIFFCCSGATSTAPQIIVDAKALAVPSAMSSGVGAPPQQSWNMPTTSAHKKIPQPEDGQAFVDHLMNKASKQIDPMAAEELKASMAAAKDRQVEAQRAVNSLPLGEVISRFDKLPTLAQGPATTAHEVLRAYQMDPHAARLISIASSGAEEEKETLRKHIEHYLRSEFPHLPEILPPEGDLSEPQYSIAYQHSRELYTVLLGMMDTNGNSLKLIVQTALLHEEVCHKISGGSGGLSGQAIYFASGIYEVFKKLSVVQDHSHVYSGSQAEAIAKYDEWKSSVLLNYGEDLTIMYPGLLDSAQRFVGWKR